MASIAALRYLSEREKWMLHAREESDTVMAVSMFRSTGYEV